MYLTLADKRSVHISKLKLGAVIKVHQSLVSTTERQSQLRFGHITGFTTMDNNSIYVKVSLASGADIVATPDQLYLFDTEETNEH
jgi:hypothetical protein